MAGQWLQPDHSLGDANTIGGYQRVHGRPAAFEGSDGLSYSVELAVDATGEPERPYGAYLLFLRWRRIGPQGVDGHLETGYVEYGETPESAREALGRWPLAEVHRVLEERIVSLRGEGERPERQWWDVMRGDD